VHGRDALLRSLAVDPGRRGRGCGLALVAAAERHAAAEGVQCVYLLTTTAAGFFERLGYAPAARADAPAAIRACAEFASLCPEDSAFMVKRLAAAP
jgi:amino-acid N-acetyltransferase